MIPGQPLVPSVVGEQSGYESGERVEQWGQVEGVE